MPTYTRDDGKPIVQFDAALEISPFALLRSLRGSHPPLLIDARSDASGRSTLAGARPYPGPGWTPETEDQAVVVFDDHGEEALPIVAELRKNGYTRVRLLFGGLELYEFSLDPAVTGQETFLVRGQS